MAAPGPRWPQGYPLCDPAGTKQFEDALSEASNGCTDKSGYNWGGPDDPTSAQRLAVCKCAVAPFKLPKCMWTKAIKYNVSTIEHFNYVYNCDDKTMPTLTEVNAINGTVAPSASAKCSSTQASGFTTALKAASSCLGAASYEWTGDANPTAAQLTEICKCPKANVTIPSCSVMKGPDLVKLSEHYNWVFSDQCGSTTSSPATAADAGKSSSSNTGMIVGIIAGVVVVLFIIGICLWKRKRAAKHVEQPPQNHSSGGHSSVPFQSLDGTPQYSSKNSHSHGMSTISTTIATANGTVHASGTHGTASSTRSTDMGKWDDPVIVAVRIPYDAIFKGNLLSRGGFGEVYRGTYRGDTVAIKSLLPERRKDLAQIDDFLSEVKLMSTLDHERIVKFIGVAWNSLSDACMVVEFMENGDLRSVLGRWSSGPEQRLNGFDADKVKIALHIAHALTYLHSLQPVVVHRDLKSKNVLLDANFDAKLTDFGISRERADATMTAGVGSSLWMAPEVMLGKRYDEKADIFAFGIVLSELDTHQLPYFHAKVSETGQKLPETAILQQVMLGRISVGFTDRADPVLVQLGRECVSLDPKDRPTTAQLLHRVYEAMRQYQ
ncbi:hypothetical protein P43SY_009971 [Pythium insidiosum]|uniref:Protein kinase domain-containing protein n=1 Tax=Pythium insidiosum TaxID=114742 RepID=A0AAD5LX48_PYTIN|nr:hypothetical protein P43SY_009971 [Pythium insidiosum]